MACLHRYFPERTAEQKQDFIDTFFPFQFGIYPYTHVTEKQRAAMDAAGVDDVFLSVYEIIYRCARKLLGVKAVGRFPAAEQKPFAAADTGIAEENAWNGEQTADRLNAWTKIIFKGGYQT